MPLPRCTVWLAATALLLAACAPSLSADSSEDGVYVVDADGSDLDLLVGDAALPAWSPDGTKLAFSGGGGIEVMAADGSGRTAIAATGYDPTWSPDGTKIAFVDSQDLALYVVGADGSNPIRLGLAPPWPGMVSWSPGGAEIAFVSTDRFDCGDPSIGPFTQDPDALNGLDVWMADADGSGSRRLPDRPGQAAGPAWSPDGTKIAFAHLSDTCFGGSQASGIYLVNADGSGLTAVLETPPCCAHPPEKPLISEPPAWSPDGAKLLFATNLGLHVINADGTGLTNLGVDGFEPAWSPDGTKIAFSAYPSTRADDTNQDVYVVNADGSGRTRVARTTGNDFSPAWSPDGTQIAFAASSYLSP